MAQHTAGPWHLDGHNLAAIIHCTAERGTPEARHVCGDYETIARCDGDNWQANARLIAAAPDLLEALKRARPHIGVGYSAAQRHTIISLVDEAIAKAEGRI